MASLALLNTEDRATPTPVLDLPLPKPGAGINRRFLPRLVRTFRVCLVDDAPQFEGLDLSFGGLMCAGQELIWPGNTVEMDLLLPGEKGPVRVSGRVAEIVSHRGRTAMRVRFENTSDAPRKRIALWMSRQV
jgi:hypothetical protein